MVNLTKIGALVKIEATGQADKYVNSNASVAIIMPSDGTAHILLQIGNFSTKLDDITDIQVAGVAVEDQADFETQIATVFPDANSGSGGSGVFPILQAPDNSLWIVGVNNSGVLQTVLTESGTPTTLTLHAPDGGEWEVTVNNSGALTTTLNP